MGKGEGRWQMGEGKRKDFPPEMTIAESLSPIVAKIL